MHTRMEKLADKTVAILGTGASAIQCILPLAESARHLYVFQRTLRQWVSATIDPTASDFSDELRPGWQRERMYNFHQVLDGQYVDDMVDDGWTHFEARVWNPRREPGMTKEEFIRRAEEEDFEIMEKHRRRIDETVTNPHYAEILKPYYRYLCKRPCFHDEYLPAFNMPNVTLVDCPAGIDPVTERGLICDGDAYEFDCLIYATGFEAEVTPLPRRAAHPIIGRGGVDLADRWADGPATLHGIVTRGFPNFFMVPAPGQQGVISVNFTLVNCEGAEHIAETIGLLEENGVRMFDVTVQAESEYVEGVVDAYTDISAVMEACTPSRLNNEGNPKAIDPCAGAYGGGRGDLFGWIKLLKEWRESGEFVGLELDQPMQLG